MCNSEKVKSLKLIIIFYKIEGVLFFCRKWHYFLQITFTDVTNEQQSNTTHFYLTKNILHHIQFDKGNNLKIFLLSEQSEKIYLDFYSFSLFEYSIKRLPYKSTYENQCKH